MSKTLKEKLLKDENLYLGLGVAMFTKDRIEDLIKFMVKEAKMAKTAAQAKKQLMANGKAQYAALLASMEKTVDKTMTKAKTPSKSIKAKLNKKKSK